MVFSHPRGSGSSHDSAPAFPYFRRRRHNRRDSCRCLLYTCCCAHSRNFYYYLLLLCQEKNVKGMSLPKFYYIISIYHEAKLIFHDTIQIHVRNVSVWSNCGLDRNKSMNDNLDKYSLIKNKSFTCSILHFHFHIKDKQVHYLFIDKQNNYTSMASSSYIISVSWTGICVRIDAVLIWNLVERHIFL